MRRVHLLSRFVGAFSCILLVLSFMSCDFLFGPKLKSSSHADESTVTLSLSIPSDSLRTVYPDGGITAASFHFVGAGPDSAAIDDTSSDNPWTSAPLARGEWTFTVYALNSEGQVIGAGQVNVTVGTDPVSVSVTINRYGDGDGSLSIALSWDTSGGEYPSDPCLVAVLTDSDGVDQTFDGKSDDSLFTYTNDSGTDIGSMTLNSAVSLPTGSYVLSLSLYERDDNGTSGDSSDDTYVFVWGRTDAVLIFKDIASTAEFTITNLNEAPDLTISVPSGVVFPGVTTALASQDSGTTIRYTTDGSDPATSGTALDYSAPITLYDLSPFTLTVAATNRFGTTTATRTYTPGDTEDAVPAIFVDWNGGDDDNPGTKDYPKRRIQIARNLAVAMNLPEIRICAAEGTYNDYGPITMFDGLTLKGGYDSSTWNDGSRDPSLTIIRTTNTSYLGTAAAPASLIYFPPGLTGIATVDGVTIEEDSIGVYNYLAGMRVASPSTATATIQNCVIRGGTGVLGSYGIFVQSGSAPIIQNNAEISGGASATLESAGIRLVGAASGTVVSGNTLIDGSGTNAATSVGILCDASSAGTIFGNTTIRGGSGTTAVGIDFQSSGAVTVAGNATIQGRSSGVGVAYGIRVSASSPAFTGTQTIESGDSGDGADVCGVYVESTAGSPSAPTIGDGTNTIMVYGGESGSMGTCYGVYLVGPESTGTYRNLDVTGRGAGSNYGIYIDGVASSGLGIRDSMIQAAVNSAIVLSDAAYATVERCRIWGGDGSNVAGVYIENLSAADGGIVLRNNSIGVGPGTSGVGVYISSGSDSYLSLYNNTILGGSDSSGSGILLKQLAAGARLNLRAINNIIIGRGNSTAAVVEADSSTGDSNPLEFAYNTVLSAASGPLYHDSDSTGDISTDVDINTDGSAITGATALTSNEGEGLDPTTMFSGGTTFPTTSTTFMAFDWTLGATATINMRTGGLNLSSRGFIDDFEGTARTSPWSRGCREY